MSNARIKSTFGGEFVDFTVDEVEGEFLGVTVKNFLVALESEDYVPFTVAAAPQGPTGVPQAQAPATGEAEVPTAEGQPGQLAKRFTSAVIEVTPRPDGKATVAFYGDDIKPPKNDYPYVTNTYQPKTWLDKFASICPFTLEDFGKPGQFSIRANVEVRYGDNKTQRGNYYKNISAITPAPGVAAQEVTTFEQAPEQPTQVSAPEDIPF